MSVPDPHGTTEAWTVDELAQRAGVPVRTIRQYQSMGLVPPPRRAGRVGLYGLPHLRRLQLIARLQGRGYSLAGIGDLLEAWRGGDALTDILGLEPDQLVHVDEPGAPATLDQLAVMLPSLVPARLEDLLATGAVEERPDGYCIPSPSVLQLAVDALGAGLDPEAVLGLLAGLSAAADSVADAVIETFSQVPADDGAADVETLVARGRGLLGHGVGRLTLHRIGRRIGVDDGDTASDLAARLATARHRTRSTDEESRRP